MPRKPRDVTNTGGISVGGSLEGSAVSTGIKTVQKVSYKRTNAPPEVLKALTEISSILERLPGPDSIAARAAAACAVKGASAAEPNKDAVGTALENALTAAKKGGDFVTAAAALAPYLQTAATWLGSQWVHLLALVA
jgi:hypothetical protein